MKILLQVTLIIPFLAVCSVYSQNHLVNKQQTEDSLTLTDPIIHVPKILYKPNIELPKGIRLDSGKVLVYVKAIIDTSGNVLNVKILKSANRAYNKKAIQLAKKYRFASGKVNGISTPLVISWAIEFIPTEKK